MIHASRPGRSRRRVIFTVALNILIPAVLIGGTVGYFEFVDYVETDPRFCGQCHALEPTYALWTRSQHRVVICQSCHHETREEALRILTTFVFDGAQPPTGKGSKRKKHVQAVDTEICAGCHASHDPRWPGIDESVGHNVHARQQGIACLRCHGRSIHSFESPRDFCADCHEEQSVIPAPMLEVHCLACHDFLSPRDDMLPTRSDCLECHRRQKSLDTTFPPDAPMAALRCSTCHRPHEPPESRIVSCEMCHADDRESAMHAVLGHDVCGACHTAHSWTWSSMEHPCDGCHEVVPDHDLPDRRLQDCVECHPFRSPGLVP